MTDTPISQPDAVALVRLASLVVKIQDCVLSD
jgi:hypothetical protein